MMRPVRKGHGFHSEPSAWAGELLLVLLIASCSQGTHRLAGAEETGELIATVVDGRDLSAVPYATVFL